uniref:adenylate cyclase n=1 Tax=Apteryx owenii TaxID=8824 RepID=A0A8B9SDD1_APTOW
MARSKAFAEPEHSAEYSAEYSVSLPSDPERAGGGGGGRSHEVTVRSSGPCLCLPRFMRLTFVPDSLENLYQTYFRRQRHETLPVLVVFAALFDCYVLALCAAAAAEHLAPALAAAVGLVAQVLLFVLCKYKLLPDRLARRLLPYVLWALILAQLFCHLGLGFARLPDAGDTVGWQAFFVFAFFITLPLRLAPIVLLTVLSCAGHTLVLAVTVSQRRQGTPEPGVLLRQILSNVAIYLCTITVGTMSYYMADRKHRKAFLEARQSLEVKINLEEQSQQQVGAGCSHGATCTVHLHHAFTPAFTPVFALFACTMHLHHAFTPAFAPCIYTMHLHCVFALCIYTVNLHHVFALYTHTMHLHCTFAVCTYLHYAFAPAFASCICTVHLHRALTYTTHLRLQGAARHGGAQRGLRPPRRRVHISQNTMDCLRGEFEVEPGEGGSRCDYLKEKGIVTYLVVVPKLPLRNGINGVKLSLPTSHGGSPLPGDTAEPNGSVTGADEPDEPDAGGRGAANPSFPNPRRRLRLRDLAERVIDVSQNEQELNKLLNEALLERESDQAMKEKSTFRLSMRFIDPEMETRYSVEKEKQSGAAFSCSCVVLFFTTLAEVCIDPWLVANYVTFVVGEILLLILTICSLAAIFPRVFPKKLVAFSTWIDRTRWARNTWAMAAIIIVTMADIVDMLSCQQDYAGFVNGTVPRTGGCGEQPKYYSYIAVLALVATIMLVQVSHMVKLTLMVLITAAVGVVNIYVWEHLFDQYDRRRGQHKGSPAWGRPGTAPGPPTPRRRLPGRTTLVPSKYSMTAMIFVVMLSFYYFSRHVEKLARILFLWKIDVHDQKERVYEMRRWNEALVTNMLPEHVARHFLGSKKRDEELYSQSYDEIGVMFASLPNFADFYTEESINNGGIECLRFLNEIISDFDALLDDPQFRCITKIKTIGSTYMAASGVTPDVNTNGFNTKKDTLSEKERWQHLADLADFALAMKVTLMNINFQSFNNFMLRIGMNKGAVLAGVIGARKPHYDIWGNTVNVASRMESTGVMGNIQVVEETHLILKEYGFRFVRRGAIFVKGKGELLTFFLKGREKQGSLVNGSSVTLPHQVVDSS